MTLNMSSTESGQNEIRLLPDEVVNQISAGEVIERPASVVRELVDNAIDAGATEIVIEVEEGGRRAIKVADNGKGLNKSDLVLAFQNHATSKLRDASDLAKISTFGFRGEALASIAAISKVEMRSRSRSSDTGNSLKIEGGQIVSIDPITKNIGTEVIAKNIFFNTPARRKFLKSGATEEAKIKQWIIQSAVPNNQVAYKLIVDGKIALNIPVASDFLDRARDFLKGELAQIDYQVGAIRVQGYVGHPGSASSKASNLLTLVNKRVIRDAQITKAVREGFSNMLKGFEVPVGIISIDMPPALVDVNVHPQKSEVRFVNSGEVFVAVRDGIQKTINLMKNPVQVEFSREQTIAAREVPTTYLASSNNSSANNSSAMSMVQPRLSLNPTSSISYSYRDNIDRFTSSAGAIATKTGQFRYCELKYIGQLMKCYLLTEYESQFVIVDMHAAHERVNFNLIKEQMSSRLVAKQILLLPEVVALTPESRNGYERWRVNLDELGFETEPFGELEILIRTVPTVLRDANPGAVVLELLSEGAELFSASAVSEVVDKVAARLACHGSIRSGKIISPEEAYSLFAALDRAESAGACPHGRPVAARFKEQDVERWFGRDR
jgi:DNA mismatch repair protein MutL